MNEEIAIKTEYIQLGQFLKLANVIDSGGMVKMFLAEYEVFVNGDLENRRGRKLYPGDQVEIENFNTFIVTKET
ncbi:S4 domain-containing protein YaaA [Aquibacillus koreensis]|uniref:S4 domain-containing protein YaaA n=1 Tax=Aquibacillus koreensis TaxID=279446 RepID=A0A9X3WSW4_9BACI|nr:S4 domain-containing protein YaaA [Aquibacillus koreensis]MCT2535518.1 S4 domain-containing protein YaaA [Aquibacillus koreensis]MDC3422749.1 S4 domain-containing protein YaaA [Aquibacillus koreensis]